VKTTVRSSEPTFSPATSWEFMYPAIADAVCPTFANPSQKAWKPTIRSS
jgi:hypothetical protein